MDQMPAYTVIIGSLSVGTISLYYCSTSKRSKLLIYKRLEVLDNQQSSHERRQTRNKKKKQHTHKIMKPPPSSASAWDGGRTFSPGRDSGVVHSLTLVSMFLSPMAI